MTFKEEYRCLQHMVSELIRLRQHNLRFKEGDPQEGIMMLAEGVLCYATMERFLRAVMAKNDRVGESESFASLLQRATSKGILKLPADKQHEASLALAGLRNTTLHGNFEQAASEARCADVADYFKSQYASEIEAAFKILNHLMQQIDTDTGRPFVSPQPKVKKALPKSGKTARRAAQKAARKAVRKQAALRLRSGANSVRVAARSSASSRPPFSMTPLRSPQRTARPGRAARRGGPCWHP
jgi:hypothetical protein